MTKPLVQWEYAEQKVSTTRWLKTLNRMGADGWELCATGKRIDRHGVLYGYTLYFKRPITAVQRILKATPGCGESVTNAPDSTTLTEGKTEYDRH